MRLTPILLVLLLGSARALADDVPMKEIQALASHGDWRELLATAIKVKPSARDADWRKLVVSAAVHVVNQSGDATSGIAGTQELLEIVPPMEGRYGFLRDDAGYLDAKARAVQRVAAACGGDEAGAFTGAVSRRIGAFEQASGGTLFLDEIGELPIELQPKLLRALESRAIRRVGSTAVVECDLRFIAATNRDLRAEVNRGTFRADLYYRLAVVRLALPPLRERREDIPLLVRTLLARLDASPEITAQLTEPAYLEVLASAAWPGNVRELRNHLAQCAVFGACLPPHVLAPARPGGDIDASQSYELARRQALDAFERTYLTRLLERTHGNVAAAARTAGVNRGYLYRMLGRHGLR